MAHKKGQGSTRNGRDSNSQRRGIKKYGGESVVPGMIIVRQVGTKVHPGKGVGLGNDYTIFAKVEGKVFYDEFTLRSGRERKRVSVIPTEPAVAAAK